MKNSSEIQPHVNEQKNSNIKSQIETDEQQLKSYINFMGVNTEKLANIADTLIPIFKQIIRYDPYSNFNQEMAVKIVRHTKDFEFVDVEVRIGYFIFPKISILNIDVKSPIHAQNNIIGQGAFSQVFRSKCHKKNMAIKCFPLSLQASKCQYRIKMALREHCILTLASALKAGPKMENVFGYNIIVYSNCVEISMELCQQIQSQKKINIPQIAQNLKQDLAKLHSLRIVHFDIKGQNIAYSPAFKRYIFIDFGFSKVMKQCIGFKSWIPFCGTYTNCSPEMRILYDSETYGFVDAYYNDAHCLKVTLGQHNKILDRMVGKVLTTETKPPLTILDSTQVLFNSFLHFAEKKELKKYSISI